MVIRGNKTTGFNDRIDLATILTKSLREPRGNNFNSAVKLRDPSFMVRRPTESKDAHQFKGSGILLVGPWINPTVAVDHSK